MRLLGEDAELDDLGKWLDPNGSSETGHELLEDGTFLRMYPAGEQPKAGALSSDTLDMDSHWHFHDMHQLVYAFEGALEAESSDGRHLIPRQLVAWIPAGVKHRLGLRKVRSGSVFLPADMVANPGNRIRILMASPLMREMMRESMRWPLQEDETPIRSTFFNAMGQLCSEWINSETDLLLPACRDPRLQRALDYTSLHPQAKATDICANAGLSERTLRRRVKSETGLTWEGYRQRQRLLSAVKQLGESSEPISAIAANCGFESPSAFAKAFRNALGMSPSEYRSRTLQG